VSSHRGVASQLPFAQAARREPRIGADTPSTRVSTTLSFISRSVAKTAGLEAAEACEIDIPAFFRRALDSAIVI
jgi:hypothetical protein